MTRNLAFSVRCFNTAAARFFSGLIDFQRSTISHVVKLFEDSVHCLYVKVAYGMAYLTYRRSGGSCGGCGGPAAPAAGREQRPLERAGWRQRSAPPAGEKNARLDRSSCACRARAARSAALRHRRSRAQRRPPASTRAARAGRPSRATTTCARRDVGRRAHHPLGHLGHAAPLVLEGSAPVRTPRAKS